MKAMALTEVGRPLVAVERDDPLPGAGEARLKILACGVCRTDLHVVEGELPDVRTPIIPGHEIVGEVESVARRWTFRSARGWASAGLGAPAAPATCAVAGSRAPLS